MERDFGKIQGTELEVFANADDYTLDVVKSIFDRVKRGEPITLQEATLADDWDAWQEAQAA